MQDDEDDPDGRRGKATKVRPRPAKTESTTKIQAGSRSRARFGPGLASRRAAGEGARFYELLRRLCVHARCLATAILNQFN